MLDEEMRTTILLLRDKDLSVRAIARTCKVSRHSVRAVVLSGSKEVPVPPRQEKAQAWEDAVRELHRIYKGNLQLVYEELLARGAAFSYSALTRYCRRHEIGTQPKLPAGRYHFGIAEEMQHDTSPHKVTIGGKVCLAQSASLVLCHSRMVFMSYYPTFDRFWAKVFLTEAFRFFGGTCKRCEIDNTHVVVAHGTGAGMVPAPEMAAFAGRFGFAFQAHELGDANRSARVERMFSAKFVVMQSKVSARSSPWAFFVGLLRIIAGPFGGPQQFDETIGRSEPSLAQGRRCREVDRLEPLRRIGAEVHFGGLQAAVAEP